MRVTFTNYVINFHFLEAKLPRRRLESDFVAVSQK